MIAVQREPKPRGRASDPGQIVKYSSGERASVAQESPTIGSGPQPSSALAARLANGLRGVWGPEGKAQRLCRLKRISADVQLVATTGASGTGGRLSILGVATCKSSLCPLCASKWAATRADEITQAVTNWGPKRCRMVTFTMRHHARMSLALQTRLLSAGVGQLFSGRAGEALKLAIGGKPEFVRGHDLTWSRERGWHPHIHSVFFFQPIPRELDNATLTNLLGDRWPDALGAGLRRMKRACARVLARTGDPIETIAGLLELDMGEPREASKARRFAKKVLKTLGPWGDGSCMKEKGCGCGECVKVRVRRVFGSRLVPRRGDFLEHVRRMAGLLDAFHQDNIRPTESTGGVHLEELRHQNKASTYLAKLGLEIAWNESKQPNRVKGIDHYPYWALAHLATIHGHPLRQHARRAWAELFAATRGTQRIVFSSRQRLGLGPDPYADENEPDDVQSADEWKRQLGSIHGQTWDVLKKAQGHGLLVSLEVAFQKGLIEGLPYVTPAAGLHGIPANRGPPHRYEHPSPLLRACRMATAEQRGRALACLLMQVELPDLHVDPIRWGTHSKVSVEDLQRRIEQAKQLRFNYQIDW